MVEALRIVDAYQFRVSSKNPQPASDAAGAPKKTKELAEPPKPGEKPWWDKFWTRKIRIRDREMFD